MSVVGVMQVRARTALITSICATLALALVGLSSGVSQAPSGVAKPYSAAGTSKFFSGETGLKITSLRRSPGDRFVSKSVVLKVTDPLMKMFNGKIRSVMLVSVSSVGNKSYINMSSSSTGQGENGNRFNEISCYFVTIEGGTNAIPVSGTTNGGTGPGTPTVQVLVAATTGRVLDTMEFPTSHGSKPISIGTMSILKNGY